MDTDNDDALPVVTIPVTDWQGPEGRRAFRVLAAQVPGPPATAFKVRVVQGPTLVALLHVPSAAAGSKLGKVVTFASDTYRVLDDPQGRAHSAPASAADHDAVLCYPWCPQRSTASAASLCLDCWEAILADYLSLLADADLVHLALATRTADALTKLAAPFASRCQARVHALGGERLRAARIWFVGARVAPELASTGVADHWLALEYLLVALEPKLYGPRAALSSHVPAVSAWFRACVESRARLRPATLFFFHRTPQGVLQGGTSGDAVRLVWRPHLHLAWCRDLLAHVRAAPPGSLPPPIYDTRLGARVPAHAVISFLGSAAAPGGDIVDRLVPRIQRAREWALAGQDGSDAWLDAVAVLMSGRKADDVMGIVGLPGGAGTPGAGGGGAGTIRAQVGRLEDLLPLMPPCMVGVVEHGRRMKHLKHYDRIYMASYLAALGQTDVREARAFLVGSADKKLDDIEDLLRPGGKIYVKSCSGIRQETTAPPAATKHNKRPPGNVMACPYTSCDDCAATHNLLPTFGTPLEFIGARVDQMLDAAEGHHV